MMVNVYADIWSSWMKPLKHRTSAHFRVHSVLNPMLGGTLTFQGALH